MAILSASRGVTPKESDFPWQMPTSFFEDLTIGQGQTFRAAPWHERRNLNRGQSISLKSSELDSRLVIRAGSASCFVQISDET